MLTQLGAGADVSLAPDIVVVAEPFVVVSEATTRMSPAGIPCASTVIEPSLTSRPSVTVRWPCAGTAGAASELMLGQPSPTGTMTTCSSPSLMEPGVGARDPRRLVHRERDRAVGVPRHRVGGALAPTAGHQGADDGPRRRAPSASGLRT